MSLVRGIHHVSLKCNGEKEFEKTISFYKELLGLQDMKRFNDDCGIMLSCEYGIIEIFKTETQRKEEGAIRHFSFDVEDCHKCIETVRQQGYTIILEPKDVDLNGLKATVGFCIGPVGEKIEFFEMKGE